MKAESPTVVGPVEAIAIGVCFYPLQKNTITTNCAWFFAFIFFGAAPPFWVENNLKAVCDHICSSEGVTIIGGGSDWGFILACGHAQRERSLWWRVGPIGRWRVSILKSVGRPRVGNQVYGKTTRNIRLEKWIKRR